MSLWRRGAPVSPSTASRCSRAPSSGRARWARSSRSICATPTAICSRSPAASRPPATRSRRCAGGSARSRHASGRATSTSPVEVARPDACLERAEPPAQRRERVAGGLESAGDLEKIAVGVAQIDRLDRAQRARPLDGALEQRDAVLGETGAPRLQRLIRQKAQVARSGGRPLGLRLELPPGRVQVDFLRSEAQRDAPLAVGHYLHAEDPAVEVARRCGVADGQDQVIQAIEHHRIDGAKMHSGRNAETIQLGVSTISLILRSTATLETMYASSRASPRSATRWSIM